MLRADSSSSYTFTSVSGNEPGASGVSGLKVQYTADLIAPQSTEYNLARCRNNDPTVYPASQFCIQLPNKLCCNYSWVK